MFVCFSEIAQIKKVTLKSGNLTCLELFQLLNKHVSSLAPVEQPVKSIQTKSEKKGKRKWTTTKDYFIIKYYGTV